MNYDSYEMPPQGKLSPEEIEHLRQWISLGAPDPREGITVDGVTVKAKSGPRAEDLWSVQPLQKIPLPPVKVGDWPRSDVDRFVLAALDARGISPSPDAAPFALLRRLHYVLTGLPPEPAEVEVFIASAKIDLAAAICCGTRLHRCQVQFV